MFPANLHRKHLPLPIQPSPSLFNDLVQSLGAKDSVAFYDVRSVYDQGLLALVPRPVMALILSFPTALEYEELLKKIDKDVPEYDGKGEGESSVWFKETIHNASGLYAILHAFSNGAARNFIEPGSHLDRLFKRCIPKGPNERALEVEADGRLAIAHELVAVRGSKSLKGSTEPKDSEGEARRHYFCFVKSSKDGHVYELDGTRKGPIVRGPVSEDDLLSGDGLAMVRLSMDHFAAASIELKLLALAPAI